MSWIKQAQHFYLDTQVFDKPGYPNWQDKIREVNNKRDIIRQKAEKLATDQGHILFPWTCMNSSLCRKCGRTVYLHNIHGSSDGPDIDGRAVTQKCDVCFDGPPKFSDYKTQDYHGNTII